MNSRDARITLPAGVVGVFLPLASAAAGSWGAVPAAAAAETIRVSLALDSLLALDATLTVQQASIQSGTLSVTASATG